MHRPGWKVTWGVEKYEMSYGIDSISIGLSLLFVMTMRRRLPIWRGVSCWQRAYCQNIRLATLCPLTLGRSDGERSHGFSANRIV
jgi:hypothetical protein